MVRKMMDEVSYAWVDDKKRYPILGVKAAYPRLGKFSRTMGLIPWVYPERTISVVIQ
jgi:hypothetical protein